MVSSIESIPLSIFIHGLALSVCSFLILCGVFALELELQSVCDEGDEFGIGGLALGVTDGVAEKSLERIQIPPIPGNLDGVPDGTLDAAGGGLECFRHLGVQYLGDGIGVPYGPPGSLAGCDV